MGVRRSSYIVKSIAAGTVVTILMTFQMGADLLEQHLKGGAPDSFARNVEWIDNFTLSWHGWVVNPHPCPGRPK